MNRIVLTSCLSFLLLTGVGCASQLFSDRQTSRPLARPIATSPVDPREEIRQLAMSCTTDMATEFHIHPTLSIIIDGKKQVIPSEIGIVDGCMSPLHTHDAFGEIHVESPKTVDFTLEDFFMVWGKTFTKDQILDSKAADTHVISLTVNGKSSEEFENLVLKDDDVIRIEYKAKK